VAQVVFGSVGLNICGSRAGGGRVITLRTRGLNCVFCVNSRVLVAALIRLLIILGHMVTLSNLNPYWREMVTIAVACLVAKLRLGRCL
jgi:hypothetical protein